MFFADLVTQIDRTAQEHLGGEPIVYAPEVGAPVTVTGIFDERYVLTQSGSEVGVETIGPAVFLTVSDLPTDPQQDRPEITIRGKSYRGTARKPDGLGGVVLELREMT